MRFVAALIGDFQRYLARTPGQACRATTQRTGQANVVVVLALVVVLLLHLLGRERERDRRLDARVEQAERLCARARRVARTLAARNALADRDALVPGLDGCM